MSIPEALVQATDRAARAAEYIQLVHSIERGAAVTAAFIATIAAVAYVFGKLIESGKE